MEERSNTPIVVAVCLAVVLVVVAIMGAVAFSIKQGTERRQTCVESGASWVNNNQCLRFIEVSDS